MTTPAPGHDADLIRERYGRVPSANSPALTVAAIAIGVVALAVLIWIATGFTKTQATSKVISFNVVDPGLTTLHFEVSKPADRTAECVLEALSTGFAEVGVKTVTIGPAPKETVAVFEEINTSELATTAIVDHCRLVD